MSQFKKEANFGLQATHTLVPNAETVVELMNKSSDMLKGPKKRVGAATTPAVAVKKRKGDEPHKPKGSFESHLEHLSQSSDGVVSTSLWDREALEEGLGNRKSIAFQVFDIETYHEPGSATTFDRTNVKLYGVTRRGNSVCAIVTDYFPYFYFQAPENFSPEHLDGAQRSLNTSIATSLRKANSSHPLSSTVVDNLVHLSIVYGENLYYYRGSEKKFPFIKVSGTTNALNKAKQELKINGILSGSAAAQVGTLYEANIDPEVKFMAKSGVVGCGWVEIPPRKGTIISKSAQSSRCQIEVEIKLPDLLVHDPEGEWADVAPIRTLSFDIECMGRRGVFPDASEDPVIQIANMVKVEGESEPFIRNCFVLGTCAPVIGSEIIQCESEKNYWKSLLELSSVHFFLYDINTWAEFVRTVDPDILTGYNILNFDLPYILDRAKVLKLPSVAMLGRQLDRASGVRDAPISSKQMGSRVNKSIDIHGRVIFDVLQVFLSDYKLRSYTLNSVSYHFLLEQKEDVEHSIISDLQRGDEHNRRRLAVYCMKDAALPLRLLEKLLSVINYMEMARVTGVPLNYLLTRGQQIKILSMMLRKAKTDNFFLPVIEVQGGESEGYEGATVIEPMRGFYNEPIATLDFASLYPSIMIAHNLCYTTLLKKPEGEEGKASNCVSYTLEIHS
ncbi:hypothetical protein KIN20_009233 [Parelaphostrongylus tenuis]|uniref:DNA polymerase delta catalytic subunit n=1 Tax=Parelaphostrongylus tenuis TaxID=148309 RepID=A0AAD5QL58_PARTN|nr:hypothetical protein KIN20_009233 [Parelaphostrongylus tenuis]